MTRRLARGTRLVVASHNPGKVREILDLVAPYGLSVVSAAELGLPEPEETGATFAENARLKAVAAARAGGPAGPGRRFGARGGGLGGAPGIYSARWAGPAKDFSVAMRRVADEVKQPGAGQAPGPRANFTAVLCLAWPDGEAALSRARFTAIWSGRPAGQGFRL